MNVAQHISDLLYRHECVIIPGLGALVSRRLPARHDADSHIIYPPTKHIGFNSSITNSDGLLIDYVSRVEDTDYVDAASAVQNFVLSIKNDLDEKGFAHISKVGQLRNAEFGAVIFTPVNVINYLPEAYGLSMYEATPLTQAKPIAIPAVEQEKEVVSHPATAAQPQNSAGWWRYVAAAAFAGALIFMGYRTYESETARQESEIAQQAAREFQDRVQESTFTVTAPLPAINLEVTALEKTHHIIAGAFRDPANATKRVAQLKAKGFKARTIGVNKYGLHNVAFSSYVDRDDAINELYRLRGLGYTSAWLFTGTLEK